MTVNELLTEVDELKPNQYDDRLKIGWISNLDMQIVNDVILTHENQPVTKDEEGNEIAFEFNGYTEADMDTELLVKEPYSELYKFFLFAMIDFYNGETDRYTNSMMMYNAAFSDYCNYYNRTHMPVGHPLRL